MPYAVDRKYRSRYVRVSFPFVRREAFAPKLSNIHISIMIGDISEASNAVLLRTRSNIQNNLCQITGRGTERKGSLFRFGADMPLLNR